MRVQWLKGESEQEEKSQWLPGRYSYMCCIGNRVVYGRERWGSVDLGNLQQQQNKTLGGKPSCGGQAENSDGCVLFHHCDNVILLPFRFNFSRAVCVTAESVSCQISTGCQTIP